MKCFLRSPYSKLPLSIMHDSAAAKCLLLNEEKATVENFIAIINFEWKIYGNSVNSRREGSHQMSVNVKPMHVLGMKQVCACVFTNLNELLVRHVSTVKRLLVVHKAWKFRFLHFLPTQHQHSGGKHALKTTSRIDSAVSGMPHGKHLPRLAHKRQHQHVICLSAGLRAERPQALKGIPAKNIVLEKKCRFLNHSGG